MIKKTKFKWEYLLVIFAIAFVFFFSLNTHLYGFITSDETVNYSFSLLYKNTGKFYYEEPLNDLADNIIRPRGVAPRDGKLTPTKSIGLSFYYGNISKIFGEKVLPYLTPIFASIGIFFVYLLGKEIFGRKNGLISGFLTLIFPPFLYWTGFSFMENVFCSVFFVLGLWAVFRGLRTKKLIYYLLAPIGLGIAWNVRPDTTLFLVPLAIVLLINIRKINIKFLAIGLLLFVLTVSPILYFNKQTYGESITTGQTFYTSSSKNVNNNGNSKAKQHIPALLPIVRLKSMIQRPNIFLTKSRILIVSAPFFLFFLFGLFWFLKRKTTSLNIGNGKHYCLFILLSILVFTFFYLSAGPIGHQPGIPTSLTRYFLPIYLACIPLLALFIQKFLKLNKIVTISFISLFIILNVFYIFPILIGTQNRQKSLVQVSDFIIKNTEPNSVIFTKTLDKIIFPRRKVIVQQFSKIGEVRKGKIVRAINNLYHKNIPLYIYYSNPHLINWFQGELDKLGLSLENIKDSALYKITKNKAI